MEHPTLQLGHCAMESLHPGFNRLNWENLESAVAEIAPR